MTEAKSFFICHFSFFIFALHTVQGLIDRENPLSLQILPVHTGLYPVINIYGGEKE
jgi:hypothetical protein